MAEAPGNTTIPEPQRTEQRTENVLCCNGGKAMAIIMGIFIAYFASAALYTESAAFGGMGGQVVALILGVISTGVGIWAFYKQNKINSKISQN